jgi:hypothetical protein
MTLPRGLYYQDSAAKTLLDSLVLMLYNAADCCQDFMIERLLPRVYYQDSAVRTLLDSLSLRKGC